MLDQLCYLLYFFDKFSYKLEVRFFERVQFSENIFFLLYKYTLANLVIFATPKQTPSVILTASNPNLVELTVIDVLVVTVLKNESVVLEINLKILSLLCSVEVSQNLLNKTLKLD